MENESNGINVKKFTHEEVKNASNKKAKLAVDEIRRQQLTRIRANISRWSNARTYAESQVNPNNSDLIRVFKDIEIDSHLWALMQTIRLKVMANSFNIYGADDEIDEDATKKFKKKWYREIIKHTVDAEFYGFSLVQLGDIVGDVFVSSTIVPREYVVQQLDGVKKSLGNSKDLISFKEGAFKNWLVPIGDKNNLGLLDKAAPLVIKKKEVISAWSEAAELFGMPMRIGRTSLSDNERRANMEEMLENIGESAWAVIDEEDEIELKETSKTDFSNMYDQFIERVNSELSKLFLSQTGTTDEKTHVGSAAVMENVLKDVIESYILRVEDITNEIVLPLCVKHGIVNAGTYIKADNEQKLSLKELFDIVKELMPSVNIPHDWISETFDIPIEEASEINVDEKAQAELRGSVGGVTGLVEIITAVSQGIIEVKAAISIIVNIFGFDPKEAKEMVGNPKVTKPEPVKQKPLQNPTSVMKDVSNLYKDVLKTCC